MHFPRAQLPPVFSPSKAMNNTHSEAKSSKAAHVEAEHDQEVPVPIQVIYLDSTEVEASNYVFAKGKCSFANQEPCQQEASEQEPIVIEPHSARAKGTRAHYGRALSA